MTKQIKQSTKLHHFFIPHHKTHQKAHLLSFKAIIVYILFFITLQFGFTGVSEFKPAVLGISADLNQQDLIKLTNVERQKAGLPALIEDSRLDKAAEEKAKNMFEENYWAHYSPSGKDPWGFINGAGYKFSFAGENLAKNFYSSKDVVDAWMTSKLGHKENILNTKYQNIGMAVIEGELNGQKTMLVVQEFGAPVGYVASGPQGNTSIPKNAEQKNLVANIPINAIPKTDVQSVAAQSLTTANYFKLDPYAITRILGLSLIVFLVFLIAVDFLIILNRRKTMVNLYTRHLSHLALLPIATTFLINYRPGSII